MRHVCRYGAIAVLALLARPDRLPAADSLGSVRQEVRTKKPDPPRADPASTPPPAERQSDYNNGFHRPNEDDDEEGDDTLALWGAAFVGAGILATSPYWIPHSLIEDEAAGSLYFAPAPYEASAGSMLYGPDVGEPPLSAFKWATRTRTEYLDDFDSLTGYRGHVLVEHENRWGFDSELNYWRESVTPGAHDELWTGDANIVLRFAQNERIQLRSGVGVAWLADDLGTDLGFNFTYGGDIYPIQPLVISADLDAGWIGHAWMLHLRSTVGLQWKQAEVFAGYDYLEIGDAQLDGLVAGVRVLF